MQPLETPWASLGSDTQRSRLPPAENDQLLQNSAKGARRPHIKVREDGGKGSASEMELHQHSIQHLALY